MAGELEARTDTDALEVLWDRLSVLSGKRVEALARVGELHMRAEKLRETLTAVEEELEEMKDLASALTSGDDTLKEDIIKLSDLPDGNYVFDVANRRVVPSGSISDIRNGQS